MTATGAASYQWRFNNTNIPEATNATLQIANVQPTNTGYYSVLAVNTTGMVPSQLAYLFLDYTTGGTTPNAAGIVPFRNKNNTYTRGIINQIGWSSGPPNNGYVQLYAGPELDEMLPIGAQGPINAAGIVGFNYYTNGYFSFPNRTVPFAPPGQSVYYRVDAVYTGGFLSAQPSTTMNLVTGTNGTTPPSNTGLLFIDYIDWPDNFENFFGGSSPANQTLITGETSSITNTFFGYGDYSVAYYQWRKNGVKIGSPINFSPASSGMGHTANAVLTITNAQPSDAGVYDVQVTLDNWYISHKTYLSLQTTNGQGVLKNFRRNATNIIYELNGAATRTYTVQWSTNLQTWQDAMTVTNLTGVISITNQIDQSRSKYFRTILK